MKTFFKISTLLFVVLAFSQCQEKASVEPTSQSARDAFYDIMKKDYLWFDRIPNIAKEDYSDPVQMIDAMVYKPLDHWTFIAKDNGATAAAATSGDVNEAFGASVAFEEDTLMVVYSIPNTPAQEIGLGRGCRILEINGEKPTARIAAQSSTSSTVKFIDNAKQVQTKTMTARAIKVSPVLYHNIIDHNGQKVGYLVFNTFNQLAIEQLKEPFQAFKSAGIETLILDMRYNGGGMVSIAQHLGSLCAPQDAVGKAFLKYLFNENNTGQNEVLPFENKTDRLTSLKKIYVLTTKGTASASEAIINGLKPFIPLYTIGQPTHGKYVGSGLFVYEGYSFAPIMFKTANHQNESDFAGGFAPMVTVDDDSYKYPWGDANDPLLKAALQHLEGKTARISSSSRFASESPKIYGWGIPQSKSMYIEPMR